MKLTPSLVGKMSSMGLYLKLVGLMGKDMHLIDLPVVMDGLPHLFPTLSACPFIPVSYLLAYYAWTSTVSGGHHKETTAAMMESAAL